MNVQTIKSYFIYYWDIIHLVEFFLTRNFDSYREIYYIFFLLRIDKKTDTIHLHNFVSINDVQYSLFK